MDLGKDPASERDAAIRECAYALLKAASDLVLIGVEGARIVQISSELIDYIDNDGRNRIIDLPACALRCADVRSAAAFCRAACSYH